MLAIGLATCALVQGGIADLQQRTAAREAALDQLVSAWRDVREARERTPGGLPAAPGAGAAAAAEALGRERLRRGDWSAVLPDHRVSLIDMPTGVRLQLARRSSPGAPR